MLWLSWSWGRSRVYLLLNFPNTASGVSLDRLCTFVGISRNPATSAIYNVKINGTDGYIVPVGFLVGTASGINFYNTADVGDC